LPEIETDHWPARSPRRRVGIAAAQNCQIPNEETIEAMKAARRGELVTVGPPGKLLASLNADC